MALLKIFVIFKNYLTWSVVAWRPKRCRLLWRRVVVWHQTITESSLGNAYICEATTFVDTRQGWRFQDNAACYKIPNVWLRAKFNNGARQGHTKIAALRPTLTTFRGWLSSRIRILRPESATSCHFIVVQLVSRVRNRLRWHPPNAWHQTLFMLHLSTWKQYRDMWHYSVSK